MRSWAGANNPRWKGGRKTHGHGYLLVAAPNHPHKDKQGYVREHRLVMEKEIGRYLLPTEDVHHLDHDKTNNDIKNLELFPSRSEHLKKYHSTDNSETWFRKGQTAHNKYLVKKPCANCANLFQPTDSTKKYCSRTCYWESKKGVEPPQLRRLHGSIT